MRLEAVSPTADCSRHAFQPFAPSSLFTSSFGFRSSEMDGRICSSNPFSSKTLLKSRSFSKISRGKAIQRSCSLNLDGVFDEEHSFRVEGTGKNSSNEEGLRNNKKKMHCATSTNSPFLGRFDFLEPMMLGIKPEFPDWPDHETASWATIEHKAKSLDIPLSLRMIKKKLQQEEGFVDSKEMESGHCSVKAAFASMVFIIVELQSCALHMREALCDEDLEVVTSKVQKEMHSSFVWLFQQVFSRTPALMLQVMIILADFGVHSTSCNAATAESTEQQIHMPSPSLLSENGNKQETVEENLAGIPEEEDLESADELGLWNSMVDEAKKMWEGVDHETMKHFVSPMSVEIEPDGYEDYHRTDLLYQMNLSQDPNNPLLLCNYARFLHLVAHDNLRAEECFKRAIQVTPPDAESLSEYANFLWTVRKDYWAAEEAYLQALALDPQNTYYAARYAIFLLKTGGKDTCFPLTKPEEVV